MTREQTLVTHENIRVQRQRKNIWTPHVIRSPMVPSFCRLELRTTTKLSPYKDTTSFFMKLQWLCIENFSGFSQIGSQISSLVFSKALRFLQCGID